MIDLLKKYFKKHPIPKGAPPIELPKDLIDHFEAFCHAYCPCGSKHLHQLTLVSTSECARCGRTIGIRSVVYYRNSPDQFPLPVVQVGYMMKPETLARRPTRGVH